MPASNKIPVSAAAKVIRAASAAGVAPAELCRAANFDFSLLADEDNQIPFAQVIKLYQCAADLTGDDAFGLHVSERADNPQSYGMLGYILTNSQTVGEALNRLLRFQQIRSDAYEFSLETDGSKAGLVYFYKTNGASKREARRHESEATLSSIVVFGRVVTNSDWTPAEVHFEHARPSNISEHERIFRAPVRFNKSATQIIFDSSFLKLPLAQADPTLGALLERQAKDLLPKFPENEADLVNQVRRLLRENLSGGLRAETICRKLGTSPRSLHRKLIAVNTYEEDRVRECLKDLVFKEKHKEKPLFYWSRPNGLQKIVDPQEGVLQHPQAVGDTDDPESVLSWIGEQKSGIFLLCDYAPYITPYGQEDAVLVRRLREIAWKLKATKTTILFVGPSFPDLKTLEKEVTQIELELPQETEIEESIEMQLERLKGNGLNINLTSETEIALLQALLGLTAGEISNVIAKAVISCQGLNEDSIKVILEEKKNVIRGSGSLTYVHPEPANNLGGYKELRAILERAAHTFSPQARSRHVEPCKGILLVGLPGCGKDLCKRVASSITNRALLDLDFGSIMGEGGGVIGSSAMSIKRALNIAGTIKGILGISEFEKAVSGMKSSNKTDGGETARTISYLLNWMQDNRDVLVFATANDVRELESEQFRIGRFSYIHFVDLPTAEDRREIFKVHISKRTLDSERFDLEKLVDKSKDFSGAEIEGAVKDGVLEAFIDGDREAETKDIIKAINQITPTAVMMSDKIEEIRTWARKNIKGAGAGSGENISALGSAGTRNIEL